MNRIEDLKNNHYIRRSNGGGIAGDAKLGGMKNDGRVRSEIQSLRFDKRLVIPSPLSKVRLAPAAPASHFTCIMNIISFI
jgi:hypothetical protein